MKPAWIVVAAGFGLNLALGNIYAWSIVSKTLSDPAGLGGFGWSKTQATLPYTVAIVALAVTMVAGGRLQDQFGPRRAALLGALLASTGLLIASYASPERIWPAILGFGLLTGTGAGLGYAAATPAAVKRFPPAQKGLVTGIVVAGFGLAPVYIAPLAHGLIATCGLNASFRILGLLVGVAAGGIALLLDRGQDPGQNPSDLARADWRQVLGDPHFLSLYLQFGAGSLAGLMMIGHLVQIAALQSPESANWGFWLVIFLAVFNAAGRVLAGRMADWIGCDVTIAAMALIQAANLLLFSSYTRPGTFMIGAALTGCTYGACASLFASASAECWGLRNFGRNYGMLFTAWGIGGVAGPLLAAHIADRTGSYVSAFHCAAALLAGAAGLAMLRQVGFPRAHVSP